MIPRNTIQAVNIALNRQAAVALIGPRQVGKTTLALDIAEHEKALYLDLELASDRAKLNDPVHFLQHYTDRLVILDEIHRVPELFQSLRSLIDQGRRQGIRTKRFLLLGSASIDLLRQSGESLAGRIEYIDMTPFTIVEIPQHDAYTLLWLRGGFPDSYLAHNDKDSFVFRLNFIRTYLERDVPQFGPRIPAETLQRLWAMLAHNQGSVLNVSSLAQALAISAPTTQSYIDLLADLLLVRRLPPLYSNMKKRVVKSPKIYVRDSGLLHALLNLADFNQLHGHPVVGMSWEGFVIENILANMPPLTQAHFYRSHANAEMDLILTFSEGQRWAIEIKQGTTIKLTKGFYNARQDLHPDQSFVIYDGQEMYPVDAHTTAISLMDFITRMTC